MPSNSKFDSNIVADAGTESISNFASIKATSFIAVGSKFIFEGDAAIQATIVAEAGALVTAASLPGSLYLAEDNIWIFTSTTEATPITVP